MLFRSRDLDADPDPDLEAYFSDRDVVAWVERDDRLQGRQFTAAKPLERPLPQQPASFDLFSTENPSDAFGAFSGSSLGADPARWTSSSSLTQPSPYPTVEWPSGPDLQAGAEAAGPSGVVRGKRRLNAAASQDTVPLSFGLDAVNKLISPIRHALPRRIVRPASGGVLTLVAIGGMGLILVSGLLHRERVKQIGRAHV